MDGHRVEDTIAQTMEDLRQGLRAYLTDAQILKIIPAIHLFGLGLLEAANQEIQEP